MLSHVDLGIVVDELELDNKHEGHSTIFDVLDKLPALDLDNQRDELLAVVDEIDSGLETLCGIDNLETLCDIYEFKKVLETFVDDDVAAGILGEFRFAPDKREIILSKQLTSPSHNLLNFSNDKSGHLSSTSRAARGANEMVDCVGAFGGTFRPRDERPLGPR